MLLPLGPVTLRHILPESIIHSHLQLSTSSSISADVGILQLPPQLAVAASYDEVRLPFPSIKPRDSNFEISSPEVRLFKSLYVSLGSVSPHAKRSPDSQGDLAPTLQVAHFTLKPRSTHSYPLCRPVPKPLP